MSCQKEMHLFLLVTLLNHLRRERQPTELLRMSFIDPWQPDQLTCILSMKSTLREQLSCTTITLGVIWFQSRGDYTSLDSWCKVKSFGSPFMPVILLKVDAAEVHTHNQDFEGGNAWAGSSWRLKASFNQKWPHFHIFFTSGLAQAYSNRDFLSTWRSFQTH